jgi:hypothetical protein
MGPTQRCHALTDRGSSSSSLVRCPLHLGVSSEIEATPTHRSTGPAEAAPESRPTFAQSLAERRSAAALVPRLSPRTIAAASVAEPDDRCHDLVRFELDIPSHS